jgi:leader peptidase (prepilin peptidase)/N-methyltransferase
VIESILAFVFGLLIGSFLNVAIHRWPRGRSVVKPRSHCVRCRKMIAWYDNIPIVSYVVLGGQCRHCGRRISIRYPLVELLTGLVFFSFVWRFGATPTAAKMCLLGAMLIALFFCDLEKRILPDELTLGGTLLGIILAAFVPIEDITSTALFWAFGLDIPKRWQSLTEAILGAGLPAFFLWFGGWLYFKLRHREGLGLGDVKLIAMVGSFLGLRAALTTLVLGSIAGSVLGYAYIKATRREVSTYELPFGTFLGAAALFLALASEVPAMHP